MRLHLKNIVKNYGSRDVLSGLNLSVLAGEDMAIMGPSGSGKTTLLNLISALDSPSSGSLMWEGKDMALMSEAELDAYRAHDLGIVFQHHYLLEHCTALENVLLPSLPLPRPQREDALERARFLMDKAHVLSCADRFPSQLSGGECQRIAVCRALVMQPRLLLADEPTGSLDHQNAVELIALLKSMKSQDMSLIMVTHWAEAAAQMSRQYRLSDGQLQGE